MADTKSIHAACNRLSEASLLTTETIRAFHALLDDVQTGGDLVESPPWLFLLSRLVKEWDEASQSYIRAVHEHLSASPADGGAS